MANLLPGEYIGEMDFHHWDGEGRNSIGYGQAVVAIGTGIEHYALAFVRLVLEEVDDLSLTVGLVANQFCP